MQKKSIVTAVAVLTILGSLTFVGTSALAQESLDGKTNMITRLAQKLGVSEDKVKVAFDEIHTEHAKEMHANMEQRLSNLVSDGKLTESQKTAILTKMEELTEKHKNMRAEMKDLTPEERKMKLDAERAELEQWAKSQNIDLSLLPFGKFGGKMIMKFKRDGNEEKVWFRAEPVEVSAITTPLAQ